MVAKEEIQLSLEELAGEVAFTLEHYHLLGTAQDGRVSPVPDARTIRYYTTLGLLERPVIDGRQARYGKRHLLQLVAIKALQGKGLPLAEIQARLYGLTDSDIESLLSGLVQEQPHKQPPIQPITWKEVVIAPGVKLLVEEGWSPAAPQEAIVEKIRVAVAALAARKSNGGEKDEHRD